MTEPSAPPPAATVATTTPAAPARPKGRSPSYPAVNLETAVRRAGQLWERERQHPTNVQTVRQHWGYRSMNGPASLTLAALRKFGLITIEGTGDARRVAVSDLAVTILDHPNPVERRAAVEKAALIPDIHREMWDQYGAATTVSDANLRWELTRERGFTETGASEFIPVYRSTVAFAQLNDSATVETQIQAEDDHGDAGDHVPSGDLTPPETPTDDPPTPAFARRRQPVSTETVQYALPLVGKPAVVIEGSFPLSADDWNQMMAVLEAMKPALTERPIAVEGPD